MILDCIQKCGVFLKSNDFAYDTPHKQLQWECIRMETSKKLKLFHQLREGSGEIGREGRSVSGS